MKNKQNFGDLHEVILVKTSCKLQFLRLFFRQKIQNGVIFFLSKKSSFTLFFGQLTSAFRRLVKHRGSKSAKTNENVSLFFRDFFRSIDNPDSGKLNKSEFWRKSQKSEFRREIKKNEVFPQQRQMRKIIRDSK